jgi:hypothetical protein
MPEMLKAVEAYHLAALLGLPQPLRVLDRVHPAKMREPPKQLNSFV